jgi:dienelactone hydrolase
MISEEDTIEIPLDDAVLKGYLHLKPNSKGLIIFAHGSGSSRLSPRNRYVAEILQNDGHSTLLMDLLTEVEDAFDKRTRKLRFDIPMLARRVSYVKQWAMDLPDAKDLPIGLFGSSTGAAAALIAAAENPIGINAIVSRGGRVDLAQDYLEKVNSATLFIVGENDRTVLKLNRDVYQKLQTEKDLRIIEGASHLFEEPGTLEQVANITSKWFSDYFLS